MEAFKFSQDNWQQVWDLSIPNLQKTQRLVCPILLQTNAIALLLSSSALSPDYRWLRAGYVNREIRSGLIVSGKDAVLDFSRRLYLNQLQVFSYPFVCEFSLIVNCIAKGDGLKLFAWEYIEES